MPASSSPDQPSGARERSLDEVKAEVLRRAGRFSPFESIRPQDAAAVMNSLTSLDRDHWAEAWCRVGLAYEAEGDARAKAGAGAHELAELFELGFDTCRVGRYPAPTSPGQPIQTPSCERMTGSRAATSPPGDGRQSASPASSTTRSTGRRFETMTTS